MKKIYIDKTDGTGERLDKFLANNINEYSRSYLIKMINSGRVKVNGKEKKPKYILAEGDQIIVDLPQAGEETHDNLAQNIDLKIIYEDDNTIVINKQPGLVVHPAAGHPEGTLVNAIINYFPKITEAVYDADNEISRQRPGLVHRLDKDTSGVIIIAKNSKTMSSLSKQIQKHTAKKTYWAICYGWPKEQSGVLLSHLGRHPKNRKLIAEVGSERGKEAISEYNVLRYMKDEKGNKVCLLEFDIKTGRTHQIRVQASNMGNPVIGDSVYGNKLSQILSARLKAQRQMLHAKCLRITLPNETKPRIFEAELPEDFRAILDSLHLSEKL